MFNKQKGISKKTVGFGAIALLSMTTVACGTTSNQSGNGGTNQTKKISFYTVQTSDTGYTKIINELSQAYEKQNPNTITFQLNSNAQSNSDQKLQILASSNQLPTMYNVNSSSLQKQLIKSGQALDLEQTLKQLGIYDQLLPSAVNLEKQEAGGLGLYSLPLELNIEGFWYNKQLFHKYNLTPPTTWDQMMADAKVLKSNGIQPFAVDGKDGWPITRLIGGYASRYYGANAMQEVSQGKLKLTDLGFIQAAQTVQEMGKDGYFGQGVATVDYNTALDEFLQGKAGMYYMGSWALRDFNNPQENKIGVNNIGLFNIPLVKGGKGDLSTWEMNTGVANGFSKTQYNSAEGQWMKYTFSNYGNKAMSELGQITGFKVNKLPSNTTQLTKDTLNTLNNVKESTLWFEAYFSPQQVTMSQNNAQLLVTGAMSPQSFMSQLQSVNSSK